jgi:hypothetical protein
MERVEKIDAQGNIHPLQLQVDRIQFLLDKMFEKQFGADDLVTLFTSEVANFFINTVEAFLSACVAKEKQIEALTAIIAFATQAVTQRLHGGAK